MHIAIASVLHIVMGAERHDLLLGIDWRLVSLLVLFMHTVKHFLTQ
jgi:hypothetical protein